MKRKWLTPAPGYEQHFDSRHKPIPVRRPARKIGRNELCPCGSGVKFKRCHAVPV